MRERNLISDDIMTKQKVLNILGLKDLYESTERFDISALELLLIQTVNLLGEKKETCENGVQV